MSEDQLRRLKRLSEVQTQFLKAYMSKRLASAAAIVRESLRLLDDAKGAGNPAAVSKIKADLAALNLDQFEVS
jgi:hypothetical protein